MHEAMMANTRPRVGRMPRGEEDAVVLKYDAGVSEPGDTLQAEVPCAGCQYNLRGLALEGACPECGRPVRETVPSSGDVIAVYALNPEQAKKMSQRSGQLGFCLGMGFLAIALWNRHTIWYHVFSLATFPVIMSMLLLQDKFVQTSKGVLVLGTDRCAWVQPKRPRVEMTINEIDCFRRGLFFFSISNVDCTARIIFPSAHPAIEQIVQWLQAAGISEQPKPHRYLNQRIAMYMVAIFATGLMILTMNLLIFLLMTVLSVTMLGLISLEIMIRRDRWRNEKLAALAVMWTGLLCIVVLKMMLLSTW